MKIANPVIALLLWVCVLAAVSVVSAASIAELQEPPTASGNTTEVPPAPPEAPPAVDPAPQETSSPEPAAEAPAAVDPAPQETPSPEPAAEAPPAGDPAPQETPSPEAAADPAEPAPQEPQSPATEAPPEPPVVNQEPAVVNQEPPSDQAPSTPPAEPVAEVIPPVEAAPAQEPAVPPADSVAQETPSTPPSEPVAQEPPATPPAEPVAEQTPAPPEPNPTEELPASTEAPAAPPAEPEPVEAVGQEATHDSNSDSDPQADDFAPAPRTYVWLSPAEVRALPITGDPNCNDRCRGAWRLLNRTSSDVPNPPNLGDMNEDTGTLTLAKALVAVRLGDSATAAALRDEVVNLLGQVIGTESAASALWIGRGVVAYVVAADIIDLPARHPQFDQIIFRPWLRSLLTREFEGRTLQSCQEERPNNWGTHCGAARTAIAAYLDDRTEMAHAATVFQGWLGDRQAYTGFDFDVDAFGWMSDVCQASGPECQPLPVNAPGAVVAGHNVDGVIVDDQRRAGAFNWPPTYTIYAYGGLGGAVVQAGILQRFGFDPWQWGNQALRRAVEWMFYDGDGKTKWDTCGDSNKRYVLDLVDHAYGSNFIARMGCPPDPSREGRNIAWTSWTHQR
jgi:hypothetical protein